jgi:hypothetical protein
MIVTHGWPGSVIEQLKIIGPLTNPEAHGGHATDVFHIVVPSLPGYGFSGKPAAAGWVPERVARTWTALMKRRGFGRNWGALITQLMGAQPAPRIARHPHQRFRAQFQPTSTRRPWRARLQESNDENLSEHLHHWLVGFDGHVEPGDGADGVNRRSAT